jgi:hypothetical protein
MNGKGRACHEQSNEVFSRARLAMANQPLAGRVSRPTFPNCGASTQRSGFTRWRDGCASRAALESRINHTNNRHPYGVPYNRW